MDLEKCEEDFLAKKKEKESQNLGRGKPRSRSRAGNGNSIVASVSEVSRAVGEKPTIPAPLKATSSSVRKERKTHRTAAMKSRNAVDLQVLKETANVDNITSVKDSEEEDSGEERENAMEMRDNVIDTEEASTMGKEKKRDLSHTKEQKEKEDPPLTNKQDGIEQSPFKACLNSCTCVVCIHLKVFGKNILFLS